MPCQVGKSPISFFLPQPGALFESIYCPAKLPYCPCLYKSRPGQYVWYCNQDGLVLGDWGVEEC
eukprot:12626721-Prorocentrum_lima.AAC.1